MGLCPKPRGDYAARMLLGAPPPDTRWGRPPPDPLLNGVRGGAPTGSGTEPQRVSGGGAPNYILAAGVWGKRRGPPAPPPLAMPLPGAIQESLQYTVLTFFSGHLLFLSFDSCRCDFDETKDI